MTDTKIGSVLLQALNPCRPLVMAKKVHRRFVGEAGLLSRGGNLDWIQSNCSSFSAVAMQLDSDLWRESEQVAARLEAHATKVLSAIPHELGGGGIYPFLYFTARFFKPKCVVETGVAAGYSSYAFLAAIKENKVGRLYSSDFPYFRLPNPERFIGVVVEESLKKNWELFIEGDESNLPRILSHVPEVNLFHYDSDKSYAGRKFSMSLLEGRMSKNGIIFMDDIQDNSYFHDYVMQNNISAWRVFEFHGKYVGMIGQLERLGP